jgi:hypothetical protein
MKRFHSLLLGAGLFLTACSGAMVDPSQPGPDSGVTSPDSGLDVQSVLSSATLGDEGCSGPTPARSGGSCIAIADAGTGPCGGLCRNSTIQIQFTAGARATPAHVEIADVELLDSTGGTVLQSLAASSPQAWDATTSTYQPWDQTVMPSSEVKSSYTISSPSWSTFGNSYPAPYRLRVTVRIDGTTVVLQSEAQYREPIVAT